MKTTKFSTIAILIGALITGIIISSFTQPHEGDNLPRYHVVEVTGPIGMDIIVYDAVTGNYKSFKYKNFKDANNIKELLEK